MQFVLSLVWHYFWLQLIALILKYNADFLTASANRYLQRFTRPRIRHLRPHLLPRPSLP